MGAEVFERFNQSIINKLERKAKPKAGKTPPQEKADNSPQTEEEPKKEEQFFDNVNETPNELRQTHY